MKAGKRNGADALMMAAPWLGRYGEIPPFEKLQTLWIYEETAVVPSAPFPSFPAHS